MTEYFQESSPDKLSWTTPVQEIPDLSEVRADFLISRGYTTVGDLLLRIPLRLIEPSPPFSDLQTSVGAEVTAVGTIESIGEKGRPRKKRLIVFISDDSGGVLSGVWFTGYRFIKPKFIPSERVAFTGKLGFYDGFQISHPKITFLKDDEDSLQSNPEALYSHSEEWQKVGFSRFQWQIFIVRIVQSWDGNGPSLPEKVRKFAKLMSIEESIQAIHIPSDGDSFELGVRSLKFAELFHHQLLMVILRRRRRQKPGTTMISGDHYIHYIEQLPFLLSAGQDKLITELTTELASGQLMHRLVQGEVGSGKTVIAFALAAIAKDGGKQTALMAPTEFLARQHYDNAIKYLKPAGVNPVLLVSGRHPDETRKALHGALTGEADLIIGTHSLFQDRVKMGNLGMVIIDEQQRFGVNQRSRLVSKGSHPHVLLMTATPIPRTLALAHYGDIDLSELPQRDTKRQVRTRVVNEEARDRVFGWLRERLGAGERGYFVFPVIDDSALGLEAAQDRFVPYRDIDFKGIPIGLVHGRLTIEERMRTMEQFRKGEIKLLLATAVIEVGVDIPDTTLMVIENSERFGLSQIHQLRGRIGRDGRKSVCVLMTTDLLGSPAYSRLQKLEECDDGATLAEADMYLRGSGDPLGARQSGGVRLRLADLPADKDILKSSHMAAEWLLDIDPLLDGFPELREVIRRIYKSGPGTFLAG